MTLTHTIVCIDSAELRVPVCWAWSMSICGLCDGKRMHELSSLCFTPACPHVDDALNELHTQLQHSDTFVQLSDITDVCVHM